MDGADPGYVRGRYGGGEVGGVEGLVDAEGIDYSPVYVLAFLLQLLIPIGMEIEGKDGWMAREQHVISKEHQPGIKEQEEAPQNLQPSFEPSVRNLMIRIFRHNRG